MRDVFITIRDKVPALPAHQGRKEPTRVGRTDHLGMLGKAEEGEPFTVALADEPVCVCLFKEDEEPGCLLQIFRNDVPQCWRTWWGLVLGLWLNTSSRCAGGGCCGMEGQ